MNLNHTPLRGTAPGPDPPTHYKFTSSRVHTVYLSLILLVCCTRGVPGASPHSLGAAGAAGAAITSVEVGVMATW